MRTWPALGLGISRSTIWKSAPGLGTCATFIGAIAILVVAMMPPSNFHPWCCHVQHGRGRTLRAPPSQSNYRNDLNAARSSAKNKDREFAAIFRDSSQSHFQETIHQGA